MSGTSSNISLHRLSGDSISMAFADGHPAVILDNGNQLHWDTLADFEAFVDALHVKVMAKIDEVDRATEAAKQAERAA